MYKIIPGYALKPSEETASKSTISGKYTQVQKLLCIYYLHVPMKFNVLALLVQIQKL